jgi:nicotinamide riboside transporter PnuC
MNIFIIVITVFSLIGTFLNIKKKNVCFIIWIFTNFSWFLIDIYKEIYPQAFLFFVYFLLAIYGIYEWRKKK